MARTFPRMSAVTVPKGAITLAALVYTPPSSRPAKQPVLIIVHPGGGVKEQAASLYASKIAERGLITLCFDASHQGESGGEPHFLEDPNSRISDVWAVVDYLQTQDFVDPERIGVLGICAGGGYAVAAAKADYRLKAVAAVSLVNIGEIARRGWRGSEDPRKHVKSLKLAAVQMTAEVTVGAERAMAGYVSSTPGQSTPYDLKQAVDYYFTPRAQHPRAANKMLVSSMPRLLNFDAFHLADIYLTQPMLLVGGEKAESRWHTEKLDELVGGVTRKVIVPGGTHMDFYDEPQYVEIAVKNIAEFMLERLTN